MSYSIDTDRKWQKKWDEWQLAKFDKSRLDKKLYTLEMFSYPSGAQLHMGHWYNYGLSDSWTRMKKMQGYEVFQPMGFDAFGLPAENYAIKTGIHPKDTTLTNIKSMEKQLREMGGLFNWEHEIATCLPEYYRWNQWLFLQLYKNGLAYRKKAPVNWCPSCQTVLANEQVQADGTCERCGTAVEHKNLTQWFFKITKYADELIEGLKTIDWPEKTKKIQTNWIGKSEGAVVDFMVEKDGRPVLDSQGEKLKLSVFTTRCDTLMGVTYVVTAPESDVVPLLVTAACEETVNAYREKTSHVDEIERQSTTREKTGVFTGAYAIHPLSGRKVPIWISDYVIAGYGTGSVMAVPCHDERDYAFAQKYHLPIEQVIAEEGSNISDTDKNAAVNPTVNASSLETMTSEKPATIETPNLFTGDGVLVNSGAYTGLRSDEARAKIPEDLEKINMGHKTIQYRLRDWLISRQRYWGTPIPIVYCEKCGTVPVPEKDLPVELPYNVEFKPDGKSPLAKSEEFMNTTCPICGGKARRDPDTLDTFVCSSWYQFRYVDNKNSTEAFDRKKVDAMCPVDMYVGGAEHAAMHLLYARFITKVLRDLGYLDFDEPFQALVHQGVILGPDGSKMSKSRGNTISPDPYTEAYGSDVLRLYLAFGFAYVDGGPWSDNGIKAIARFVNRVETEITEILQFIKAKTGSNVRELLQKNAHLLSRAEVDAYFDGSACKKYKAESAAAGVVTGANNAETGCCPGEAEGAQGGCCSGEAEGAEGACCSEKADCAGQESTVHGGNYCFNFADIMPQNQAGKALHQRLHYTIKEITRDADKFQFNTSIARLMELLNSLQKYFADKENIEPPFLSYIVYSFIKLLAPFAPHFAEEYWEHMGFDQSVFRSAYPIADEKALVLDTVEIAIQVNGKVKSHVEVAAEADAADVENKIRSLPNIAEILGGKTPVKWIYIKGRLMNIVVK